MTKYDYTNHLRIEGIYSRNLDNMIFIQDVLRFMKIKDAY